MSAGIVVQLAVDSLAAAGLYALVALAVSLAFNGSGVIHLAIGQVALAGALAAAWLYTEGAPVWLAAPAGLAVGGALSGLAERGLVARQIASPALGTVLLLAAAVVAQGVLGGLFPRPAYPFPTPGGAYPVFGGIVRQADLVTISVVVLVACAGLVTLRSSRVGASLRVTAASPGVAERLGVDTARVRTASFAVGGVLATWALLLGVSRFPLAAGGVIALPLRGIAGAVAGRMTAPLPILGAVLLIAVAEVVGGYELGGAGEFLADAVAVLLIAVGARR